MPLSECTRTCASLARALQTIESTSSSSYVVGGFIRDVLLSRPSRDVDVALLGDPFAVAREVARVHGGAFVPLDQEHGVARVVLHSQSIAGSDTTLPDADDLVLDFSRYEGQIEDDLVRRDFTIDAIAVPTAEVVAQLTARSECSASIVEHAIDPLGGLQHLANRVLRHGSVGVFEDDPGRLLRAVRLARELAFAIDPDTEARITACAHRISDVAAERTREELLRLLEMPHAADSIRHLDRLGLLTRIFPELEVCRDVEQPTCHFWDVLEHSIQTVATFEFVAGESDWRFGNDEMLDCLPKESAFQTYVSGAVSASASRATLIKLACLLHDVCKPQTKTLDDSGRARFLGHARHGASIAQTMLQRLRFSTQEISYIEMLIYNHLRPAQMSPEGLPTARAVYRFFRDTGTAGVGVLYLAMADYLACRGPLFTMFEWRGICRLVEFILNEHVRQQVATAPPRLIDGREIMRALALTPGPMVGTILEAIQEAQAAGLVTSKEDALQLARRIAQSEQFTVRT